MSTITRFLVSHRSESLMCALVALLLAAPLGDSRPHTGGIIALLVLLVLLAGASYLADRKITPSNENGHGSNGLTPICPLFTSSHAVTSTR